MTMTERLLEATKEIWDGYNETPFVKEIADGSLDHEKFKYYTIQDYLYLLDYTKVFSIGTAKAKNLDAMRLFAGYTHSILDGEMDIHRAYMTRLGIAKEEAEQTPEALSEICQAGDIPVVAIGGINKDRLEPLKGTGVDGVAVVSAIFAAEDIEKATRELKEAVREIL